MNVMDGGGDQTCLVDRGGVGVGVGVEGTKLNSTGEEEREDTA
jgi:hypothetical protein